MNKFVERFEELKDEKGLNYFQISKATGISHATISRWASGKMLPNIDSIIVLCEFFGCTAGYLIGIEN